MTTLQERITDAFKTENERRSDLGLPKLTKTDLWKAAKVSSSACTFWFDGSSGIDLNTATKVAPLLNVNARWLFDGTGDRLLPSSDIQTESSTGQSPSLDKGDSMRLATVSRLKPGSDILIPQYATGGAMGTGLMLPDQPGQIHGWRVNREWIEKNARNYSSIGNLCIVTGFGDSMRPLYHPGDPLLVDNGINTVEFDGIYFFRIGEEGFIKRLQRIPTGAGTIYRAKSENEKYDPWDITPDMDFEVLGRVIRVWCGTDF